MTLNNKLLWPLFEQRFVIKEVLTHRFNQLCELRNGIRHSRAVGEVTRKQGRGSRAPVVSECAWQVTSDLRPYPAQG